MSLSSVPSRLTGLYLYCLTRSANPEILAARIPGAMAGVDERFQVSLVRDGDLAAIVSEVDLADFSEANLQTLAWLAPRALRHEALVALAIGDAPVLPVKFGTIFATRSTLEAFLNLHRQTITTALNELDGRSEWSVKGYAVEATLRELVVQRDPAIAARLGSLAAAPGLRYLQQKQLEPQIEAAVRTWLKSTLDDLHEQLAACAIGAAALRCHASSVTGRDDQMIFNCSFLLDDSAVADFSLAVDALARRLDGSGLTFELRGPWPPYNFCPSFADSAA